jgi:hypothetical protein
VALSNVGSDMNQLPLGRTPRRAVQLGAVEGAEDPVQHP